jgi:hypothetical protein
MSYNMQAEGLNGVSAPTNIAANNWSHTTSPAPVLKVDAFQQFQPHNLTALECAGSGTGAGVIGRSERGTAMIGAAKGDAEGVHGESETGIGVLGKNGGVGPAVKGLGGDASNPSAVNPDATPVKAGLGVIAVGGASAAGFSIQTPKQVIVFAALPAGPGVVAVAGGAAVPDALEFSSETGVVGMGSPEQNGFPAGRGGVFGSAKGSGNIAQLQLVPTLNPATQVPRVGTFGDLYVSVTAAAGTGGRLTTSMYLCILAGDGVKNSAEWTMFQTQGTFQAPL